MDAITIPVVSSKGAQVDSVSVDAKLLGEKISTGAVYQTVTTYLANQRKGLAETKTRGEVSGGGKKPWKQKGTGRARAGSTRSPLWRHGGVVFGPHPRNFSIPLPQAIKTRALQSALSAKVHEQKLIVVEGLSVESQKTKDAALLFKNLKINLVKNKRHAVLVLIEKDDAGLRRAMRNLRLVTLTVAKDANAYEVLAHKNVVITKTALELLIKRLQK